MEEVKHHSLLWRHGKFSPFSSVNVSIMANPTSGHCQRRGQSFGGGKDSDIRCNETISSMYQSEMVHLKPQELN